MNHCTHASCTTPFRESPKPAVVTFSNSILSVAAGYRAHAQVRWSLYYGWGGVWETKIKPPPKVWLLEGESRCRLRVFFSFLFVVSSFFLAGFLHRGVTQLIYDVAFFDARRAVEWILLDFGFRHSWWCKWYGSGRFLEVLFMLKCIVKKLKTRKVCLIIRFSLNYLHLVRA